MIVRGEVVGVQIRLLSADPGYWTPETPDHDLVVRLDTADGPLTINLPCPPDWTGVGTGAAVELRVLPETP